MIHYQMHGNQNRKSKISIRLAGNVQEEKAMKTLFFLLHLKNKKVTESQRNNAHQEGEKSLQPILLVEIVLLYTWSMCLAKE